MNSLCTKTQQKATSVVPQGARYIGVSLYTHFRFSIVAMNTLSHQCLSIHVILPTDPVLIQAIAACTVVSSCTHLLYVLLKLRCNIDIPISGEVFDGFQEVCISVLELHLRRHSCTLTVGIEQYSYCVPSSKGTILYKKFVIFTSHAHFAIAKPMEPRGFSTLPTTGTKVVVES